MTQNLRHSLIRCIFVSSREAIIASLTTKTRITMSNFAQKVSEYKQLVQDSNRLIEPTYFHQIKDAVQEGNLDPKDGLNIYEALSYVEEDGHSVQKELDYLLMFPPSF